MTNRAMAVSAPAAEVTDSSPARSVGKPVSPSLCSNPACQRLGVPKHTGTPCAVAQRRHGANVVVHKDVVVHTTAPVVVHKKATAKRSGDRHKATAQRRQYKTEWQAKQRQKAQRQPSGVETDRQERAGSTQRKGPVRSPQPKPSTTGGAV